MTKFDFIKMHLVLHVKKFIELFGSPVSTYGGPWEKAHIGMLKVPYTRTGRNVANLDTLLIKRFKTTKVVSEMKWQQLRLRRINLAMGIKTKGDDWTVEYWKKTATRGVAEVDYAEVSK